MSDLVQAVAQTLAETGRFAVVTGREWDGAQDLVEAAAVHVVAPGAGTRLSVAAGFALGGRRAVTLVDELPPGATPEAGVLAFTTSTECARNGLSAGWTVVQPWAAADVAELLAAAGDRHALVMLGGEAEVPDDDPPSARWTRMWLDGELATLVGSGTAVPTMVHLAGRLQQRGVDIAAVEVALLDSPGQLPLVGGAALLVGGQDTAVLFRNPRWPDLPVHPVELHNRTEADLIGAVLALISAAG